MTTAHDGLPRKLGARTGAPHPTWLPCSGTGPLGLIAPLSIGSGPSPGSRGGEWAEAHEDASDFAAQFRVLIVEDEWFIAMESESVLRNGGYSVVGVAGTADEAVALAAQERPDIVLMDIRLRGKRDGIDAALEIRERHGIPCIFATAHTEQNMRERGAAAEPLGWLDKPFSEEQLLRALKTALARLE